MSMLDLEVLIPSTISSECSLNRYDNKGEPMPVCMSGESLALIAGDLKVTASKPIEILNQLKQETNCDTEKCVIKDAGHKLGQQKVSQELLVNFKHEGPTDDKLLSNYNIDGILKQYSTWFPNFIPLNFNMRNYADYRFRDGYVEESPDTLATVGVSDWIKQKTKLGCVINTDVYQGEGKHWMALFVDTTTTPCTVEFFNSSGNAPLSEYIRWLEKTKLQLEDLGKPSKICVVSRIQHQNSRSECGVYSLFYIYARLKGVPWTAFQDVKIEDKWMFHFRQLLFTGDKEFTGKFNWNLYQKKVNIKWE